MYTKVLSIGILLVFLLACKNKSTDHNSAHTKKSAKKNKLSHTNKFTTADSIAVNEQLDAFADYYVVVADTGVNYYSLQEKMVTIQNILNIPIDTMGRYYNKAKDLIALPDNDEDEIFAGDYFGRRTPSNSLSLEYLDFYKPGSKKKTIALVTGIYENKQSADSALKTLSGRVNAFAFKSHVYVGCLH